MLHFPMLHLLPAGWLMALQDSTVLFWWHGQASWLVLTGILPQSGMDMPAGLCWQATGW